MDFYIEGTEDQPEETRISICNVLQQVMISQDFDHIQKDIANDFALSDLISDLIKQSVQNIAEEVVSRYPKDQQYLADAKVGAYECWIQRLTGMLEKSELDYLLDLMQKRVDEVKERE